MIANNNSNNNNNNNNNNQNNYSRAINVSGTSSIDINNSINNNNSENEEINIFERCLKIDEDDFKYTSYEEDDQPHQQNKYKELVHKNSNSNINDGNSINHSTNGEFKKKKKKKKIVKKSNSFYFFNNRIVTGPDKLFFFISNVFIIVPSLLFIIELIPNSSKISNGLENFNYIFSIFFLFFSLYYLYLSGFIDPGILPRGPPIEKKYQSAFKRKLPSSTNQQSQLQSQQNQKLKQFLIKQRELENNNNNNKQIHNIDDRLSVDSNETNLSNLDDHYIVEMEDYRNQINNGEYNVDDDDDDDDDEHDNQNEEPEEEEEEEEEEESHVIIEEEEEEENRVEKENGNMDGDQGKQEEEKLYQEIIIKDYFKLKLKYCETCNIYRPPRSFHCSTCNNCVQNFDHHCVWIGNCIGQRNYKYFLFFIFSTLIHALYICIMSIVLLCNHVNSFSHHQNNNNINNNSGSNSITSSSNDLNERFEKSLDNILLALRTRIGAICFIVLLGLLLLSSYHAQLVLANKSTMEDYKKHFENQANPFDKGKINNILDRIFLSKKISFLIN